MKRLLRIYKIWKAGRILTAKKMKWFNEYRGWYFSYYGEWPKTADEVKRFFEIRMGFHGMSYEQWQKIGE